MVFLSSFEAIRYRGLDGLSLPRLGHANLVTGTNGIGKTALLEAIWLFTGRRNPGLLWNSNVHRSGNPVIDPVATLAADSLELHGTERGCPRQWKTTFQHVEEIAPAASSAEHHPPFPVIGQLRTWIDGDETGSSVARMPNGAAAVQLSTPLEHRPACVIEGTSWQLETPDEHIQRYSDMVRDGRKRQLTAALGLVLPKLQDLEILADKTGKPYISTTTASGQQLPLKDLGGGIVRLFRLCLGFFAARDGMMLADEMENGIHHSVLKELWQRVRLWLHEWNVQFVATTHSAECVEAAMAAFADDPDSLAIHKLFADGESGRIKAATFTGETLEGARDLRLEVR